MEDFSLNSIGRLLSGGGLNAISKRVKVDKQDVAKVLSAGIPALVGGMRRNAGAKAGEKSLAKALKDHSADDVSNPADFLKNADLKDGKKILAHVLGDDQKALIKEISKASGVTEGKSTSILSMAAPLLLSVLGSQNNTQQSSASSGNLLGLLGGLLGGGQQQTQQSSLGLLGGLLGGTQQQAQPQQQSAGLLGSLLGGGQQQAQPQQQSASLLSSLLGGSASSNESLATGLFSSLMGGQSGDSNTIQIVDQQSAQQEEQSSGGLLDSFLNLFH